MRSFIHLHLSSERERENKHMYCIKKAFINDMRSKICITEMKTK